MICPSRVLAKENDVVDEKSMHAWVLGENARSLKSEKASAQ